MTSRERGRSRDVVDVDVVVGARAEHGLALVVVPERGDDVGDDQVGRVLGDQAQHEHAVLKLHTHPFNVPFSGTTRVSLYQKGKTNLDFTEARDSEWQWHQLGHMQVCTLLQRDNHTSNTTLFFTGRMPFLPPNQQRQSTEGSNS